MNWKWKWNWNGNGNEMEVKEGKLGGQRGGGTAS